MISIQNTKVNMSASSKLPNKALLRIFQCNTLAELRYITGNSFRCVVYREDLEAVEDSIKKQLTHSMHDLDYAE